jgi:predicted CopG family antitoxin
MTKVNIQVEDSTRDELSSLGKHRESYDDIIKRLLTQNKSQKKGDGSR